MITDKVSIANKFNVFFTNIGEKIAKGINYDGNKNYGHYLNKDIHSSFTFMNIDEDAQTITDGKVTSARRTSSFAYLHTL